MQVIVIIPAAGLGTRMASAAGKATRAEKSKQFLEIGGVPVLVHTLRKFAGPSIHRIVVAMRKSEAAGFRKQIEAEAFAKKVEIVEGGENRQESVANALRAVKAADNDIVLVHDAVRPLIDTDVIASVIAMAQKTGAAIAGVPAIDTIKQVDRTANGAVVTSTIPRERIVNAQTPQGFRFAVIKKAFDEAVAEGFTGTDEASAVERMGHDVAVVMGSPRNIKITTPADLELAEFFLSVENRRKASLTG
jgi:2-C-methyl-D-erythritol 4-phosphate cytidylyltransferase